MKEVHGLRIISLLFFSALQSDSGQMSYVLELDLLLVSGSYTRVAR